MTTERGERSLENMAPHSNLPELAVRFHQRRNSPERNEREREQHSATKFETSEQFTFAQNDDCRCYGEQRRPTDRTFRQKREGERKIKCEPPTRAAVAKDQFVSGPVRECDEEHEPHVRHGRFGVFDYLKRKCENDRRPKPDAFVGDAAAPREDRQGGQRGRDGRWKTRGQIILPEYAIAGDLRPVSERRFIESIFVVEVGDNVILAFDHFARRFGKARLVAIDQRNDPGAGDVKEDATGEEEEKISSCRLQSVD